MSVQISSQFSNYTYNINVYIPSIPTPEKGFGVIYVLDGQNYFDFVKKSVDLQCKNEQKTKVSPLIVVSINHQPEDFLSRRYQDFTAEASTYVFPEKMQGRHPKSVGGALSFHHFITKELKPYIHTNYPVDISNETLYGHSLSGYYCLWTLFQYPDTFANYLAISPSIWWNNYEMWTMTECFLTKNHTNKTVFLTAGELEGFMATDIQTLYHKLSNSNLALNYYIAPEENHSSVVPTTISRALRFINTK